jgi:hypothetical protein
MSNSHICECCLNERKRTVADPKREAMPLAKDKYTLEDAVVFAKVTKGILSYEFANTLTYDEAVIHYAGSKEGADLYNGASFIFDESSHRREPSSLVNDFIFTDILGIKRHCQACTLSLTKKIQSSNITDIETLEIALSEFVVGVLKRNIRGRYNK